ncbi:MAG: sodium:solute symporter family protein [Candidatus Sumerlaeia bacterium]|nr:sodium:solute symporter family protein [Candidatus Sumerlaeia bacterium]
MFISFLSAITLLVAAAPTSGEIKLWTWIIVSLTFALYIGIAIATRVKSTAGFYIAEQGVHPVVNGMATGADWMSAASYLSMAGIISFSGYDGSVYLMGWTGGFVLLALLLAPYLRKFGKFTVPDFVGDRYYSQTARLVAVLCAIFISFTYVAGQMRGVGIVFSRFLEIGVNQGVIAGMVLVFIYAVLGGMKGITYTQAAQYVILIVAYLIPAFAISAKLSGNPIPMLGFGGNFQEGQFAGRALLETLDALHRDLGFPEYTAAYAKGKTPMIDMICLTLALMVGTAGLPHVIIRFYTTKDVRTARYSGFWALLFIAVLYLTAPSIAVFARVNLLDTLSQKPYAEAPRWFKTWEETGLIAWVDKNGDGQINYLPGPAFVKQNALVPKLVEGERALGTHGEPLFENAATEGPNELYIDKDIMVLANPEIAQLPAWVVGMVAAGGLAAALSTAAGLLLVISSAISHDLMKKMLRPAMSESEELLWARGAAIFAVLGAGLLGIYPLAFVAEVVAYAFGLAASSFFPIIVLGIFWKRTSREGAIVGMLSGIGFTTSYILYYKTLFVSQQGRPPVHADYWMQISPEGIGTVGMLICFAVTIAVSLITPPPPKEVQEAVENLRLPR